MPPSFAQPCSCAVAGWPACAIVAASHRRRGDAGRALGRPALPHRAVARHYLGTDLRDAFVLTATINRKNGQRAAGLRKKLYALFSEEVQAHMLGGSRHGGAGGGAAGEGGGSGGATGASGATAGHGAVECGITYDQGGGAALRINVVLLNLSDYNKARSRLLALCQADPQIEKPAILESHELTPFQVKVAGARVERDGRVLRSVQIDQYEHDDASPDETASTYSQSVRPAVSSSVVHALQRITSYSAVDIGELLHLVAKEFLKSHGRKIVSGLYSRLEEGLAGVQLEFPCVVHHVLALDYLNRSDEGSFNFLSANAHFHKGFDGRGDSSSRVSPKVFIYSPSWVEEKWFDSLHEPAWHADDAMRTLLSELCSECAPLATAAASTARMTTTSAKAFALLSAMDKATSRDAAKEHVGALSSYFDSMMQASKRRSRAADVGCDGADCDDAGAAGARGTESASRVVDLPASAATAAGVAAAAAGADEMKAEEREAAPDERHAAVTDLQLLHAQKRWDDVVCDRHGVQVRRVPLVIVVPHAEMLRELSLPPHAEMPDGVDGHIAISDIYMADGHIPLFLKCLKFKLMDSAKRNGGLPRACAYRG